MSDINVYQFAINNIKKHIANNPAESKGFIFNAFGAANVLSVAFMKDEKEVLLDIISDTSLQNCTI